MELEDGAGLTLSVWHGQVVLAINGQESHFDRTGANGLIKRLKTVLGELPEEVTPVPEEKAGDIVTLTAEEHAALKAAAGQ